MRDTGTSEDFDDCLCIWQLATNIDLCQYRYMSKLLATATLAKEAAAGEALATATSALLDPAGTAACCAPLSQQPLSAEQAAQVAPLLKALADPVRLRLMSLIASHPGGEACVCDLTGAFDLSQPTISHHLKVLHETGLIHRDKRGVWVFYRARTDALASLATLIGTPPA
jgi:ArsR family transcriptional regulator, arsenate/arsenite/antimonite-responsive transcriptional repressor